MLIESQVAMNANAIAGTVLEDNLIHDATSILKHPSPLKHLGSIILGEIAAVLRAPFL